MCWFHKKIKEVSEPNPTIGLEPCGLLDLHEYSSILLNKLESMGCEGEIYLPDKEMKLYRKYDVQQNMKLVEIAAMNFTDEVDCDDFASLAFSKGLGLVWTEVHALNFFIDDNLEFYFVEPQSNMILTNLQEWQGKTVRFFLGR
jgi:hypothetical protein